MEAQLPEPGSFVRADIGDTPILVTRDADGAVHAMVNRCSHRGAPLVMAQAGRTPRLTCLHHHWCYELDGRLRSVTHEGGTRGRGGMPEDFDKARHGLQRLRLHHLAGLIFGTLSQDTPDFEAYAGAEIIANTQRVCGRAPLVVLGEIRQLVHANWKLCAETARDTYHGRTLHPFKSVMKLDQLAPHGGGRPCGADGRHHIAYVRMDIDPDGEATDTSGELRNAALSTYGKGLRDREMAQVWDDHGDGLTLTLQALFPAFAQHQLRNALSLCTMVPLGPDRTELRWIAFGYADDDARRTRGRLKQANMGGPAGFTAVEDALVAGLIQRGIGSAADGRSLLRMGGDDVAPVEGTRATEAGLRGFWKGYRALMEA
jgi:phenylpropionate dioxygenase-like ring-hydroxylating dioxygenase large terminal subunit